MKIVKFTINMVKKDGNTKNSKISKLVISNMQECVHNAENDKPAFPKSLSKVFPNFIKI